MPTPQTAEEPLADALFAAAIIVVSALFYWQTLSLPAPRYEPLGSAAVPQTLCVIMALLAAVQLVRALRAARAGTSAAADADSDSDSDSDDNGAAAFRRRPGLAVAVFAATVLYVAAMDVGLLGFVTATATYLLLLGLALGGLRPRRLPYVIGFALSLTIASHLLFTRVFYIDLP